MPPVRAEAKGVGVSPKRLFPIIGLVRGKRVSEALATLQVLPSPAAREVFKVVKSAAANAENNLLMDAATLRVTHISANKGPVLRRFDPRARGRVGRIQKRFSRILVIVDQEENTRGA